MSLWNDQTCLLLLFAFSLKYLGRVLGEWFWESDLDVGYLVFTDEKTACILTVEEGE